MENLLKRHPNPQVRGFFWREDWWNKLLASSISQHWNTAINKHPVELDKTKAPSHANQEILKWTLQQHLRSLSKQIKLLLKKSTERNKTWTMRTVLSHVDLIQSITIIRKNLTSPPLSQLRQKWIPLSPHPYFVLIEAVSLHRCVSVGAALVGGLSLIRDLIKTELSLRVR